MKPVMVITGASSGIGKSCANYFQDKYQIITIHRSPGATIQGDLRNASFRKSIVDHIIPDVFINNAGGECDGDYLAMLELNGVAATDMLLQFYNKMETGHIFNIGSAATHHMRWPNMEQKWIPYIAAKNMISSASIRLSETRAKNVKVTLIEPDFVSGTPTIPYEFPQTHYNEFQVDRFTPMRPEDVALAIENEMSQPAWLVRSVIALSLVSCGPPGR
jgi:NADP-dependent 3-hydroxy acid dehydrogenase YdfG